MNPDHSGVILTNDDATHCKAFAVEKNYWNDTFIRHFVPRTRITKAPEINRGYYARVKAMDMLIEKMYRKFSHSLQLVNLGAGYDTLYWRLADRGARLSKFVEVDFPQVVRKKIGIINRVASLTQHIQDASQDSDQKYLHSTNYDIISGDLTNSDEILSSLSTCNLDADAPTVFLAECVLVYMDLQASSKLLTNLAANFSAAYFISYEQVNLTDKFGQVMVANLKQRNCTLFGGDACQSLETQKQRFLENGWKHADNQTMLAIYNSLPAADVERISKLEFLDEVELLHQLLEHYCITWACNHSSDVFQSLSFP